VQLERRRQLTVRRRGDEVLLRRHVQPRVHDHRLPPHNPTVSNKSSAI
jgi:hypothetical protein